MKKNLMVALAALLFAVALVSPTSANAQVAVRVGVGPVFRPYVRVMAPPVVVAAPAYAYEGAVVAPAPAYVPDYVLIGGGWYPRAYAVRHFGWHEGYRGYGYRAGYRAYGYRR
jgi:hypothetical protein